MDDLDISWIQEHEKEVHIQEHCIKEPQDKIQLCFLYISQKNEIERVVYEDLVLDNKNYKEEARGLGNHEIHETTKDPKRFISKENLLGIIQKHKDKHKLIDIYLYFVDIEPDKIQNYVHNQDWNNLSNTSFKKQSVFEDIIIAPSIFIFHSVHIVYFLFQEHKEHNKTKRVSFDLREHNKKTHKNWREL
jgi:hypothetical protein